MECENDNCNKETEVYKGNVNQHCKSCYLYFKQNGSYPILSATTKEVKRSVEALKPLFITGDQQARIASNILNIVYKRNRSKEKIVQETEYFYKEINRILRGEQLENKDN